MRRLLTLLMIAAVCTIAVEAQSPLFRTGVDAVEVDVSVTRGGRPVTDLTAQNFEVSDNGTRQQVTLARRSDLPLRVVMVLDTSASVRGRRLQRLIEAGGTLNDALTPADQVSLITFANDVRLRIPMGSPGPHVREALGQLSGGGPTAMYDALSLALAAEADQRIRSLILVFSDGRDTSSWTWLSRLIVTARQASSVVHIVRFLYDKSLDDLAKAAGGRTFSSGSEDDLKVLFARALEEMRSRYVLSYTLTGQEQKGWHDIKVSLKNARGDVTARPGYFVR